MKFNWGTGIFAFIVLFLLTMVGIIVFSFTQQVNLVTPEYYPKGVKYEDQINKLKNTALLKEKVSIQIQENKVILNFPPKFKSKEITGSVQLYYVADFKKDKKFELNVDENGQQKFTFKALVAGRYIIKIDWADDEKGYYQEIELNL